MLAAHYLLLRNLHVTFVTLSGSLFVLRGALHLAAHPVVNRLWMRVLSRGASTRRCSRWACC